MKLTVNNFEEKEAKRSYEEPFFRAVISIKDDGTSGPREFIRALLYSSAIESPDIEKVLDVQKYAEYTEYMDDERKDPKGILGFNITDASTLREFFEVASRESIDKFWKKFRNIRDLDKFPDIVNNYVGYTSPMSRNLFICPDTTIYPGVKKLMVSRINVDSSITRSMVGDDSYYNFVVSSRLNFNDIIEEIIKAYPDMEFYMVTMLKPGTSFIFEEKKMINDPVFNYEYTKEDLNNAQKPFIAHYDKDKLTKVDSDAISDENNKLPNALLWYGFIIEREEAHVCKNPDCKAIIVDRYFYNTKCPYCGKKKFGFSVVKTGSAELKELFGPIYEIINSNKIYSVLDL